MKFKFTSSRHQLEGKKKKCGPLCHTLLKIKLHRTFDEETSNNLFRNDLNAKQNEWTEDKHARTVINTNGHQNLKNAAIIYKVCQKNRWTLLYVTMSFIRTAQYVPPGPFHQWEGKSLNFLLNSHLHLFNQTLLIPDHVWQ